MRIFYAFFLFLLLVVTEARTIIKSHLNPSDVKYFESKLDTNLGYWSPSTSSIDWCERNYVLTKYIAEFWNCLSSLVMCLLSSILILRGLYYKIEYRFLLLSLSFGIVGFGSAYFHGTLTHLGQMADELPMVYSMIIWWFILFRMNKYKINFNETIKTIDLLILLGIFYALLWTYVHSLKTFVIIFQLHFTLMVLGGILKLIFLYIDKNTTICWLLDQYLCEQMNRKYYFNPQLHAWWHVICAIDCHIGIVCAEAMRFLSIKYQQMKNMKSVQQEDSFKPEDHLHIIVYCGLPFVDYSKDKLNNRIKTE